MSKQYYKGQLDNLETSDYPTTVQFRDGEGNKTHCINLNNDSIDVIIKYLKGLKGTTMEIKKLDKYSKSTLNNVLIKHLEVYADGRVTVVDEKDNVETFHPDYFNGKNSADFLIRMIGHETSINIYKV